MQLGHSLSCGPSLERQRIERSLRIKALLSKRRRSQLNPASGTRTWLRATRTPALADKGPALVKARRARKGASKGAGRVFSATVEPLAGGGS